MIPSPLSGSPRAARGFTLFEVGLSLVIVTFAVVTVLMFIPMGLRAQQKSRFQLLASAKALELIEQFSGKSGGERVADFETPEPWEARPFCYSSTRWDIECRVSRWDSGVIPLPNDIAARIDSDGDEIQRVLAGGGQVFYIDPRALPSVDPRYVVPDAPNEAQKLVFAVVGYAQNNAIPVLPWKAWPYRAAYPSPPLFAALNAGQRFPPAPAALSQVTTSDGELWDSFEGWNNGNPAPSPATVRDPLMHAIFRATASFENTMRGQNLPLAQRNADVAPLKPVRDALVAAVLAYCQDKYTNGPLTGSLPVSGRNPAGEFQDYLLAPGVTDFATLGRQYDDDFNALCRAAEQLPGEAYNLAKARTRAELALRVQCLRFMAFAMATYYQRHQTDLADIDLSVFTFNGQPLSADRLRYYHDRCKQFAMRYAAGCPYDWGAPRPITRSIMMDNPLIEFDLFSPPRGGTIAGTSPAVQAAMWRPVSAQTVTSIGMPAVYPGVLAGATWDNSRSPFLPMDDRSAGQALWGDGSHFTLTRPFEPSERCRQLVFWSVDWQAYEDFETAPGATLDASRCPLTGPSANNLGSYDNRLNQGLPVEDGLYLRNPERSLSFRSDISGLATGTAVNPYLVSLFDGDLGNGNRKALLGRYGADRNHNYVLDRGTLPRSVRQRAMSVARFNVYDPRIPITLR
jgi:hypothetical protein